MTNKADINLYLEFMEAMNKKDRLKCIDFLKESIL